jgi:pimeloyl-ACP methyl ester carboxylesterase
MLDTINVGNLTLASAQPRPGTHARPPMLFIPGYFASAWVYESYLPFFAAARVARCRRERCSAASP